MNLIPPPDKRQTANGDSQPATDGISTAFVAALAAPCSTRTLTCSYSATVRSSAATAPTVAARARIRSRTSPSSPASRPFANAVFAAGTAKRKSTTCAMLEPPRASSVWNATSRSCSDAGRETGPPLPTESNPPASSWTSPCRRYPRTNPKPWHHDPSRIRPPMPMLMPPQRSRPKARPLHWTLEDPTLTPRPHANPPTKATTTTTTTTT